MSARIVDGKALGLKIQKELSERVSSLKGQGVVPHLAVVIAGDDPASHVYVKNKERACGRCGIISTRIDMPGSSNLKEIKEVVNSLNSDPD
ncbi:MAG: tetrahydrofolate dehydrogenase/cyclohydrolase catalytic domain-containing protein, partial [Candidatus Thermoplasmatota archaeon]|nr:tetrahydrofolate dehydrogenase/cyclohydrolase catalytic domain-containing protein [Candidatus Thermoplasmatota archaeon]